MADEQRRELGKVRALRRPRAVHEHRTRVLPGPGGISSVPDSRAAPLRNCTSSWRTPTRAAGFPSITAGPVPNRAVPVLGERVAKPEPIENAEPDG